MMTPIIRAEAVGYLVYRNARKTSRFIGEMDNAAGAARFL